MNAEEFIAGLARFKSESKGGFKSGQLTVYGATTRTGKTSMLPFSIRSSQIILHRHNEQSLVAVLTDALGSRGEWPEYAIYGDRIYKRDANVPMERSMGEFHSIFGAREYIALSASDQATVRNDLRSIPALAKALIFIP